ncbi:MAG: YdcF family protein [Deltaproteobacteria bacterium]|nr:YdcF family protein [Deltaproteobacteria bacterium]
MGRRRGARPWATALITLLACLAAGIVAALATQLAVRSDRRRLLGHLGLALCCIIVAFVGLIGDPLAQKVAARLVMPAGLIFWALFSATASAFWIGQRRRGLAFAAALTIYNCAGSSFIGALLMRSLESRYPAFDLTTGLPFDAVLVLGGGSKRGPKRFELSMSGDRVLLGAQLYFLKKTPVLITSGHGIEGLSEEDISEQTSEIWRSLGIPASAIVRLPEPINTTQEIAALHSLVLQRGYERVGLVTSAWHMPRAMGLAVRRGLELIPIPADHRGEMPAFGPVDFVPSADGFQRIQTALWELMGRAVGR